TRTFPDTAAPSEERSRGLAAGAVVTTPESESEAVNATATLVLFQPAALAAGVAAPNTSVGGVLSILMPDAVAALLTFPALSLQVPDADWPAASAVRDAAPVQLAIPDKLSVPVNVMVTFVLF